MSSFNLSLPIDIPWRRIAFHEDMIDRKAGDRDFPLRWRTSVAVYDYQPDDDYQNYEGMIVSYLKVSCSITGFQPRGDEVGMHHSDAKFGASDTSTGDYLIDPSRWKDSRVIQAYKDAIEDYYGCYGAILEVTVTPQGSANVLSKIPASDFPFFIDFEPKKRELYEVVTETGEAMSRSLSGLNVRKGSTTTDSHEVLDIFGGASVSASYAGTGGGASVQGQWGTKDINQTEYVDMRTTDAAREKRESFSHTTQLSQMYHQLNSYHLGTNRAVFYVLPRPHIVQLTSENPDEIDRSTFVDGPRLLEGVQDFFLVVLRPDTIPDICVEAYLETAHIFQERIPEFRDAPFFIDQFAVNGSLNEREGETERIDNEEDAKDFLERVVEGAAGAGIGLAFGGPIGALIGAVFGAAWNEAFGDTLDKTTMTAIARHFSPDSDDLEFDLSRRTEATCSPVNDRKQYLGCEIIQDTFDEDEITFIGSVFSQKFTENTFFFDTGSRSELGNATIEVRVPQRFKKPVLVNGTKSLFLTGRGVSSCVNREHKYEISSPYIVWEAYMPTLEAESTGADEAVSGTEAPLIGTPNSMSRVDANKVGAAIARNIFRSKNHVDRKPRGKVSFVESEFFAASIGKILSTDPSDNVDLSNTDGLDKKIVAAIKKKGKRVFRSDVLMANVSLIMKRLDLDYESARKLRRAALGLVTFEEAEKLSDQKIKPVTVPNLVGLRLAEAERELARLQLRISKRTHEDNQLPRGTVINQKPAANDSVEIGTAVEIQTSTGLSVRIPDVVGMNTSDAIVSLAKAGLKCSPKIEYQSGVGHKEHGMVVAVTPPERDYITPNATVLLMVGDCSEKLTMSKE